MRAISKPEQIAYLHCRCAAGASGTKRSSTSSLPAHFDCTTSARSRCYVVPRQYLGLPERSLVGEFVLYRITTASSKFRRGLVGGACLGLHSPSYREDSLSTLPSGKMRIQFVSVETGHRPAIQSQSAGSQNAVCGLQRAVAEGVSSIRGLFPTK